MLLPCVYVWRTARRPGLLRVPHTARAAALLRVVTVLLLLLSRATLLSGTKRTAGGGQLAVSNRGADSRRVLRRSLQEGTEP